MIGAGVSMGAIDETRKLLQDLVTPDLKALDARVLALEQKMDLKFDHLDKKVDLKFDLLTATMAANQASIMHYLDIERRLERLEIEKMNQKSLDRPS